MQFDNRVICFINNLAIIKDDNGDVFYTDIPQEHILIGDFVIESDLKPISQLSPEIQKYVLEKLA